MFTYSNYLFSGYVNSKSCAKRDDAQ